MERNEQLHIQHKSQMAHKMAILWAFCLIFTATTAYTTLPQAGLVSGATGVLVQAADQGLKMFVRVDDRAMTFNSNLRLIKGSTFTL